MTNLINKLVQLSEDNPHLFYKEKDNSSSASKNKTKYNRDMLDRRSYYIKLIEERFGLIDLSKKGQVCLNMRHALKREDGTIYGGAILKYVDTYTLSDLDNRQGKGLSWPLKFASQMQLFTGRCYSTMSPSPHLLQEMWAFVFDFLGNFVIMELHDILINTHRDEPSLISNFNDPNDVPDQTFYIPSCKWTIQDNLKYNTPHLYKLNKDALPLEQYIPCL